jgi:hypothetical protein
MIQEQLSGSTQEKDTIRLLAHVKPEALSFFTDHGCVVQQQRDVDTVLFPAGSRQEKLSPTSKRCSTIVLPDGTVITAMDCNSRSILLLIDLSLGHTTHLTY